MVSYLSTFEVAIRMITKIVSFMFDLIMAMFIVACMAFLFVMAANEQILFDSTVPYYEEIKE